MVGKNAADGELPPIGMMSAKGRLLWNSCVKDFIYCVARPSNSAESDRTRGGYVSKNNLKFLYQALVPKQLRCRGKGNESAGNWKAFFAQVMKSLMDLHNEEDWIKFPLYKQMNGNFKVGMYRRTVYIFQNIYC